MHSEKENIMGYERIPLLIVKLSLPLMVSMLIMALYNIVDSIYVARYSEDALTAVSLVFPLQNLLIAFGVGTGVGMGSFMSRKLGEKDTESAERAAGNGLTLITITWVAFALTGLFLSRPFLALFSDDPGLLDMASDYSVIVLTSSIFVLVSMMNERILQSTGESVPSMITQMTGAVANIILDPIFIFTLDMGVKGAAWATVLGQAMGCAVSFYFISRNRYIKLSPRHLGLKKNIVLSIYNVGAPTIVTNSIGTVMTASMNAILIAFSTTAVSVFNIYFKLQSFVFMPIFGLSSGMVPIIAFNYGAKNRRRMTEAIRTGAVIAVAIMAVGTLVFNIFPRSLLSLFSASEEMYRIGIPALRTISLCFVSAAVAISLGSSFQATGFGIGTMIVSICRQLFVLIPVAYILSRFMGLGGVWYSFLIAEVVGLGVSLLLYRHVYRTRISVIEI